LRIPLKEEGIGVERRPKKQGERQDYFTDNTLVPLGRITKECR